MANNNEPHQEMPADAALFRMGAISMVLGLLLGIGVSPFRRRTFKQSCPRSQPTTTGWWSTSLSSWETSSCSLAS